MKRILGIVIIIFSSIFLLIGVACTIGFFFAKRNEIGALIAGFCFLSVGSGMMWGGIKLFRKGKPIGGEDGLSGTLLANSWIPATLGDFDYQYFFRPHKSGKHGHPSQLTVTIVDEFPLTYVARPKGWFDAFGVRVGLAKPLPIPDPEFNDRVYIETEYPDPISGFYSQPGPRQAAIEILHRGFEKISKEPKQITAIWTGYPVMERDNTGDLEDTAMRLSYLAQETSRAENPDALKMELSRSYLYPFLKIVLILSLVALGVGTLVGLLADSWRPPLPLRYLDLVSLSFQWIVPTLVLHLFATFFLLKGRTTSHKEWLFCGISGLFVYILLIPWSLHLFNVNFDSSNDIVFKGRIINKSEEKHKGKSSYYVTLPSREGGDAKHTFSVTADLFRQVQAGTPFQLVTKKGTMGIEWVVSLEIQPEPLQLFNPFLPRP